MKLVNRICVTVVRKSIVSVIHFFCCHIFSRFYVPFFVAFVVAMYFFGGRSAPSPKFRDLSHFSVSPYVCKYFNYPGSLGIKYMCKRCVMTHNPNIISLASSMGGWAKRKLHCRVLGISVSRFITSWADMLFVLLEEKTKFECAL